MLLLTGFGLGCLTLIFIVVLRDFRDLAIAKVFLALLLAASAFLLRTHIPLRFEWLAGDIMTTLPALFWLLCQLAFARRPKLFSVWAVLAVYSFVAPAVGRSFGADTETSGNLYLWTWYMPQFAEYVVLLNGLWVIVSNWKDDLIESRRRLRVALLVTVGFTGLWVTVSMNNGNGGSLSLPIVVSICALIGGSLLLKGRDGVLLGIQVSQGGGGLAVKQLEQAPLNEQVITQANTHSEAALKLKQLMDEGFYRTEKLTLKEISLQIDLPVYKTRALINSTFNYRNFNDYINQLRIEEASQRLVQEPNTPIQNIALDVGYRTLSSFNRAFKEILDQTPSDFRHKAK